MAIVAKLQARASWAYEAELQRWRGWERVCGDRQFKNKTKPVSLKKRSTVHLEEKYVNPFTDFGFKKLFGSEPNKEFLIDFLNTLLPENHKIEDLTYTKSEHLGSSALDRKAIFDLYCTGKDGQKFIVEVQKAKQNFFKDRSVYYSTFPIQEQAKRGDWDFRLE